MENHSVHGDCVGGSGVGANGTCSGYQNQTFWQLVSSSEHLKHGSGWTGILVVAYSAIFVVGLVGNITVILVISRCSQMKTVTNLFILNLAVADLFVVLFCLPGTLVANIFIPWVFNSIICKTMSYTQGVSVCASVYSLVAISVDRCRALYRPIGQSHGFSKFQAKLIILLIWTIGLLLTAPWLFVFHVVYSNDGYGYPYCQEVWSNQIYGQVYFVAVHFILCFCFPLVIITVLNTVIWWNMKKFARVTLQQQLPSRYNINGITKLLVIITVTFILSWLPLYVLITKIKLFSSHDDPPAKAPDHPAGEEGALQEKTSLIILDSDAEDELSLMGVLLPMAQLMGSFNSCVNPILYAFHNRKFRDCITSFWRS